MQVRQSVGEQDPQLAEQVATIISNSLIPNCSVIAPFYFQIFTFKIESVSESPGEFV
jgi:hypothetical protein